MPLFGTTVVWVALFALIAAIGLYLFGGPRLVTWGRAAFLLAVACVLSAAATLGILLVTHRFDVAYIYQYSAKAMRPLYWFPSFWAGQQGSFLLWAFWTSILGVVLAFTAGKAERRVMPLYSVILLFLMVMLVLRSPFLPNDMVPTPTEGLGLNPNLENPWMVIHPPTLFLGFSALAVPFVFALSALFWRDWDGWLRRALSWGLFGFAILGLAMMMGGYWAYEMLGWGGFWEWDPVENGPFVPWMGLIAFLHAAQIQRVRGGFQKPTLFFALLPFVGGLYETFLTRTGVLDKFSVHSFSTLGGDANSVLLGVLLLATVVAIGALLWRGREIKGGETTLDSATSREFGYTLSIILLTLCAVIACAGMSAPLLTGLGVKMHLAAYTSSVREDYHNKAMFPLAVLLAIGMGIGPHLAWKGRTNPDAGRLVICYALSVLAAVAFIVIGRFVGSNLPGPKIIPQLLLFTASIFALLANGLLLATRLRNKVPASPELGAGGARKPWTVGGFLSHAGVAVMLIGIVCLVTFVHKDTGLEFAKDFPQQVLGGAYTIIYRGQTSDFRTDHNNALKFDILSRDGKQKIATELPFTLRPDESGTPTLFRHPAIAHHDGSDLYLDVTRGPDEFYPKGRVPFSVNLGQTRQFGPYTIQFVKFERDPQAAALAMSGQMPDKFPVWADLNVTYRGKTQLVRPESITLRDQPGDPETPEIALPGTQLISFQSMNAGSADKDNPNAGADAEAGAFVMRPAGPAVEAFQLDVSTRPMISLVWIGTLLIVFGGLISMRRRILENKAYPIPDLPIPLPQGEGGTKRREGSSGSRRRAKGRAAGARPAPTMAAGKSPRGGG